MKQKDAYQDGYNTYTRSKGMEHRHSHLLGAFQAVVQMARSIDRPKEFLRGMDDAKHQEWKGQGTFKGGEKAAEDRRLKEIRDYEKEN